MRDWHWGNNA